MRRSKEENLFEGQKGAAWVKTKQGILEAWFLPKGQDFDRLEIAETVTTDGHFRYAFGGLSHVPPTMNSSHRISYIKDGRALFEVWANAALAAKLRQSTANVR
jgi:hypothetical protein